MVRNTFVISVLIVLIGCTKRFYIQRDKYQQPILNNKSQYTFTKIPNGEDLKKIDTSAYYVQVFEGRYYNEGEISNPSILIFHNDGYFKRESLLYFGMHDEHRNKNSVYYGGKYQIDDNKIMLQSFGKFPDVRWWYRMISEGEIVGDKIYFKDPNSITVYQKKKELSSKN